VHGFRCCDSCILFSILGSLLFVFFWGGAEFDVLVRSRVLVNGWVLVVLPLGGAWVLVVGGWVLLVCGGGGVVWVRFILLARWLWSLMGLGVLVVVGFALGWFSVDGGLRRLGPLGCIRRLGVLFWVRVVIGGRL